MKFHLKESKSQNINRFSFAFLNNFYIQFTYHKHLHKVTHTEKIHILLANG